jgi:hypothetical protein
MKQDRKLRVAGLVADVAADVAMTVAAMIAGRVSVGNHVGKTQRSQAYERDSGTRSQ